MTHNMKMRNRDLNFTNLQKVPAEAYLVHVQASLDAKS